MQQSYSMQAPDQTPEHTRTPAERAEILRLLIDGRWIEARSGKTFPIICPADQSVLAYVAEGAEADVDCAVRAARKAFDEGAWSGRAPAERGALLHRLAALIERDSEEIAHLEAMDCGKPITDTRRSDVPSTIECFRFFAGLADKIYGDTIPTRGQMFTFTRREPIGVIGQIVPWNYPLLLAAWKLAPALATGNTVVLKPAEETALSTIHLGRLFLEAGFPPGVVNIVTGYGEVAGRALAMHPQVDKIAFTGSTSVGREIIHASSGNLKQLSLELGGKGPNIVFADADITSAVKGAMKAAYVNQGQICCAGSRLLLERGIHDEFLAEMSLAIDRIKLGHPLDPDTTMGPLISRRQYESVLHYLRIGVDEGATILRGGRKADGNGLGTGFYVLPTLFTCEHNNVTIAREEIFGPVATAIPFSGEHEALALANDTIYGLSAGVWTQDLRRAHRMAQNLKAGTVWVNCYNKNEASMPFGGYKMSGYGREQGTEAAQAYTQVKSVWINLE